MSNSACCCQDEAAWIVCEIATPKGTVPVVSTRLELKDLLGAIKVRWGIGRDDYKIAPGLYAVGSPDSEAPVLVSANYKLSFDSLRKELTALDCWILVLDTKGINVWCAAGKGTFGTAELMKRIVKTGLPEIVAHKTVILPQLGATGVSSLEVAKRIGFTVIYGPVRARDIPAFLASGMKATPQMRRVRFNAWDRLILTPVELVPAAKVSLSIFGVLFLLNLFAARPFGLADFIAYAGAVLTGTVLTPLLLPLIPGRAFAAKGWITGLIWTALCVWLNGWLAAADWMLAVGYLLALPAYSAFLAMNFTGASTYTSFSGVIKEMKIAVPLIIAALAAGLILILLKTFIG